MKVVSLVDNRRLSDRPDLRAEAGLALWIITRDVRILFDTGVSGLFHSNAQRLNVDTAQASHAVVSHHHFDHGGGLATFFEWNARAKVYMRRSATEELYLRLFAVVKRHVGLDESLLQRNQARIAIADEFAEIAPGVFILTKIGTRHATPKGNRHLYVHTSEGARPDGFEHELILVIREKTGLAVFTGCSHHGILNMLDSVLEHFPGEKVSAVVGGFHLIDIPVLNTMAGRPQDVQELGRAILKYPIDKVFTGHCTGLKAYRILKEVMGARLEYLAAGSEVEIEA